MSTDSRDTTLAKARAFVRLIGQIQRRFERIGKPLLEKEGLTGTQYLVLLRVHDRPGLVQGELSALLDLDANTVSDVVRRLQKRSLIVRSDHVSDRRAYTLELTEAGRERVHRVRRRIDRISLYLYRSLPSGGEDLVAQWLQTAATIERIPQR